MIIKDQAIAKISPLSESRLQTGQAQLGRGKGSGAEGEMGSLMAGWNSPVLDSQVVKYQRNRSYTKQEIEAYRRNNKITEEERPPDAASLRGKQENIRRAAEERLRRLSSVTLTGRECQISNIRWSDSILEEPKKISSWWTRSSWAFLNDAPLIELEPHCKYTSENKA